MSELLSEDEDLSVGDVEIPENLNWIFSSKGQSFFGKVLHTVGVPESMTIESNAARTILSRTENSTFNTEVFTAFLKEISACFLASYTGAEQIKCSNKKIIVLEKSIKSLPEDLSLKKKWSCLLQSCGLEASDGTNTLLIHVIQHFWSFLILNESHEFIELDNSASCSSSSTTQSFTDNIESKSIRDHAGWVLKRVRDLFNSGPDTYKVRVSKSDSSEIDTAVARTLMGGGGCLFIYSCSARLVSFEIKFKFINLKRN